MTTWTCDRCKATIESEYFAVYIEGAKTHKQPAIANAAQGSYRWHFDICKKCQAEMCRFVAGERIEELPPR